jgi:hypothetical protein
MTWLRKPKPTKGCKANGRTRTRTWRTKICHVISVRAAVILTAVSLRFIFVLTSHPGLSFPPTFCVYFSCSSVRASVWAKWMHIGNFGGHGGHSKFGSMS